jgi:lipid II isoglutaminyl synthase (glutamine-hydrolysing)
MIRILELFSEQFALNGDMGNALVLTVRARAAGLETEVIRHAPGDPIPDDAGIVTLGTGPESAQRLVAGELRAIGPRLRALVDAGVPLLAANGGMASLGETVQLADGETIEGPGVLPIATVPAARVLTTAYVVDRPGERLVGIENHATATRLSGGAAFARTVTGEGNRDGGGEGVRIGNAIGTHLHGPVLSMNPGLADELLAIAAERAGQRYVRSAEHDRLDGLALAARRLLLTQAGLEAEPSSGS